MLWEGRQSSTQWACYLPSLSQYPFIYLGREEQVRVKCLCSRIQHVGPHRVRNHNLGIVSPELYHWAMRASYLRWPYLRCPIPCFTFFLTIISFPWDCMLTLNVDVIMATTTMRKHFTEKKKKKRFILSRSSYVQLRMTDVHNDRLLFKLKTIN